MPAPKPYNKSVFKPNVQQRPIPPQAPPKQTPVPQVPRQLVRQHVPPVTHPIYVPRRNSGNRYAVGWRPSRTFWTWAPVVVVGLILCIPLYLFIVSIATANPYPPNTGALTLNDPLQDNSKAYGWENDTTHDRLGGICKFTTEGYHISMPTIHSEEYCPAQASNFSNFAFEVSMKVIKGDGGGMIFRAASTDPKNIKYYEFNVYSNGYYLLRLWTGNTWRALVPLTFSSSITQGINQSNVIAVVANNNTIMLFVNHQQISSFNDNTYSQGQIGLVALPYSKGHPTEVMYNNAKVWTF